MPLPLVYTVRRATPDDDRLLAALAQLDSARPLVGRALLAECDGRAVAALELETGRAVADPFAPSVDAVALLTLRRAQLRAPARPRHRREGRRLLRRLLPA